MDKEDPMDDSYYHRTRSWVAMAARDYLTAKQAFTAYRTRILVPPTTQKRIYQQVTDNTAAESAAMEVNEANEKALERLSMSHTFLANIGGFKVKITHRQRDPAVAEMGEVAASPVLNPDVSASVVETGNVGTDASPSLKCNVPTAVVREKDKAETGPVPNPKQNVPTETVYEGIVLDNTGLGK
jgi:hypothetical protein